MTKEKVMEQLTELFIEVFDDDSIVLSETTTANDIEDWDSLTHLQIIASVERFYKIHFTLGQIQNLNNVGDLRDVVIKHLS